MYFESAEMLNNEIYATVVTESSCLKSRRDEVFEHPAGHYIEVGPLKGRSAQLSRTHSNDGGTQTLRIPSFKIITSIRNRTYAILYNYPATLVFSVLYLLH